MDSPPHGKILVLSPRERGTRLRKNAVARVLMKYAERETPFVGILVDLTGVEYQFSSLDVGGMAAAIAAWVRGWVAPCAIAMRGQPADNLRKVLDITDLSSLEELRVVETADLGLQHIVGHLARVRNA